MNNEQSNNNQNQLNNDILQDNQNEQSLNSQNINETKHIDELLIPNNSEENNVLQPPSITIVNTDQNNNQTHVEIPREIINDKHLEIVDDINPITSDLNKVSEQVKQVSESPKSSVNFLSQSRTVFDKVPDNMELLQHYVGNNSNKIINRFFNFKSLLFRSLYYAYRKMYFVGIMFFIIFLALSYYFHNLYISVIYLVFVGLLFNPLYNIKARKDINKIKMKYLEMDALSLNQICISKGGTSISRLFVAFVTELIILYAFVVFLIPEKFIDFVSEYGLYVEINDYVMNISFDESKITDKLNKQGIYISKVDNDFIVLDYFDIKQLPKRFKLNEEKTTSSLVQYEVNDLSGINRCRFDIKSVTGYNDKNELIGNLSKFYKMQINQKEVNNIKWDYMIYDKSFYKYYYYITEVDKKIVMVTFRTTRNSLKDCVSVENNILDYITRK